MKRKRHSPEQIIRKLREADRWLSEGKTIGEICQRLAVSEQTYHRWRNQYGGMKANDANSENLRKLLPGPLGAWTASFTNTNASMDNGFWFRGEDVTIEADNVILHSGKLNSAGVVLKDDGLAEHPPRVGHFTVGDFDFTLFTLHLTFKDSEASESAREFRHILDFLDAYFHTAGHDPDVIIAGDFNVPSKLSGDNEDGFTMDAIIAEDPRFQAGERRLAVTVYDKTSRKANGEPNRNFDHFILSADCLEEFIGARRMDTSILMDHSNELQSDGTRRRTSDHFPIVAFFKTRGAGVSRDLQ